MSTTAGKIQKPATKFDKNRDMLARDAIMAARIALLLRHPFFGQQLVRMRLVNADDWLPTLATNGRDMYYNSEFVLKMSPGEVQFGLGHELLHCIYAHLMRFGKRNPQLSNIAADYAVNLDLVENNIGKKITTVPILYDEKYRGWTFEQIYDELLKKTEEQIQKMAGGVLDEHLDGDGDGDDGDDGDQDGDGSAPGTNGNGSSRGPRNISEEERKEISDEIREGMLNAFKNSQGAGNIPAGVRRLVSELTEPMIDWRDLIPNAIKATVKSDYSYMRINRKAMAQGLVIPGMTVDETIDIVVFLDNSGSIGGDMLRDFLSEVVGATETYTSYKIKIMTFDTKVYGEKDYDENNGDEIPNYEIRGGGGTSFECMFDYMKDNQIEPKLMIVFTDGEPNNTWGDENYCNTVWILQNPYNKKIIPPFGAYARYEPKKGVTEQG